MIRLPSLSALRAFEAVGRTKSVRAAGEELSVSPTVVSRHLQNLQAELGVDLVEPRGRGLALTPAGEAFHEQVAQAFDLLRQAVRNVRPAHRESLNVWCMPGIANRRLLPRLPELQDRLEGVEIILQPTLSRPDLSRDEADAEIVYLREPEPSRHLRSELIARPRVFPVASPAFLARYPRLKAPSDLLAVPLIHEESTEQWEEWFRSIGLAAVPPLRGPRLWHAHLAVEAARLGQGVALANRFLAGEDLAAGRLVEVVSSDVRLGGYYLVAPTGRWRDPAIGALRNWVKSSLSDETGTDAFNASVTTNS
ncbi:LysR substrate-binding domain-containing protein [Microvirga thermotolerans]|uniref:LysR family transcriptional regulator n=1 Tax=Microvirga thermotolerans TaxID=2651334 RepID=A0A5P9JXE0_9HYPH|nr:LysR substrate-binding domain-containing protein [Microvirga thermotolerans]QFU17512.1 LysR family transcriptional regulator [Microvirga thermotolerans]